MPTSKQINESIEVLRSANVAVTTMTALDQWNAARLKSEAKHVTSREGLAELFDGISPKTLAEAGIV